MRRARLTPLILIVVIAAAALANTVIPGNSPNLGLDLQGGASVVLRPKESVDDSRLEQAREIIRNRVDGLGVAEPDIHIEGGNIVVALPGVQNAQRALEVVGQTAKLRFRPVLCSYAPIGDIAAQGACSQYVTPPVDPGATTTTAPSTDPAATSSTIASTTSTALDPTGTTQQGFGLTDGELAAPLQTDTSTTATTVAPSTTSTTAASTTSTSTAADSTTTSSTDGSTTTSSLVVPEPTCGTYQTELEEDEEDVRVVLPEIREGEIVGCLILGPTFLTGDAITGAEALFPQGSWIVELNLRGGAAGIDTWNQVAGLCFNYDATCPTRQIAIVLDSVVQSAPQIQPDAQVFSPFGKDEIQISGGSAGFAEREAKDLELVLDYGALPVELIPQTVETVSATLGEDSLRAGLIAGFGGLALVALYILLYYRALGVVVILGVAVWSALNYSIICYLSGQSGLALTLAGVTGIIVSVGVTVDSYVVYFERLKDEIRSGKTIRSSVDRGFKRAFRTILAADISSFIGAALLYWLTVGSVRGFAFFLGLATVLDVVVAYMFTRPLVGVLGRSRFFTEARWVGVARGLAARPTSRPATAPGGGS